MIQALPNPPLDDIAAHLRRLADQIESGDLQGATAAVVVVEPNDEGGELAVFGYGNADLPTAHLLLAGGQRHLVELAYGGDQ